MKDTLNVQNAEEYLNSLADSLGIDLNAPLDDKKFKQNDNGFTCENCGKIVKPLGYTSRDHCPYCLYSKHVDINPGDRKNSCLGLMEPVDVEKFKDTYKIIYRCKKCGEFHKNVLASDDDWDAFIKISKH
jgi:DNA-directed RNA polymerase subunit RPC12/RpoP